jgi:hypothetical protein
LKCHRIVEREDHLIINIVETKKNKAREVVVNDTITFAAAVIGFLANI